jgi:hypothetical protein
MIKQKVLVIAYYFPPVNTVAANRAASWAKYFSSNGFHPVFITRHWNEKFDLKTNHSNFASDINFEQHDLYDIYRLPPKQNLWLRIFQNNLLKLKLFSQFTYFLLSLLGRFNTESDAEASFEEFLNSHLKTNTYDLIIATSPPLNVVRLAFSLYKKFKIPYYIDFRDLWNNDYLKDNHTPSKKQSYIDKAKIFWLKKWMQDCNGVTAVSQPIADVIGLVYDGYREVVYNGYDHELYEGHDRKPLDYFSITMSGTFYKNQNLNILSEGLQLFFKDKIPSKTKLVLVGLNENPTVLAKLVNGIDSDFIINHNRVLAEVNAQILMNSNVLLHAGWQGYKGVFTTKIFDYLASKTKILLAPSDNDVLEKLINDTSFGKVVENSESVSIALNEWYNDWLEGKLTKNLDSIVVESFSRKIQTERFINFIRKRQLSSISSNYKVFVLAYYFPPNNGAPAWRPYSWAREFHKHGINATFLTRNWLGTENNWEEILKPNNRPSTYRNHEHYDLFSVPTKQHFLLKKHLNTSIFNLIINKVAYLYLNLLGYFNPEIDGSITFKKFVKNHFKHNSYDAIVISTPPANMFKFAKWFKENTNAKVIFDFRDLWNNEMLSVNYSPNLKMWFLDKLKKYYHRKWLKYADTSTVIIGAFNSILSKISAKNFYVVYNGYEKYLFSNIKKDKSNIFRFAVVGSIYSGQNLNIMLDGLTLFLKNKDLNQISLRFIGINMVREVADLIRDKLPSEITLITDRVDKETALSETINSDVLFYSGWQQYKGIISTKAFDYIASGNKILIAPGDGDVLDDLVLSTNTGEIANSVDEFVVILDKWYADWVKDGYLLSNGNIDKIDFYSREQQAEIMANIIKSD